MRNIDLVIDDLLASIEPEYFAIELDCSSNDPNRIGQKLLIHLTQLNDIDEITDFMKENLGRIGVHKVLSKIGLVFSKNVQFGTLMEMWLNYRGLSAKFPRARPRELAQNLREAATQVSINANYYEAIEVAAPELKRLLRFISAYFMPYPEEGRKHENRHRCSYCASAGT